MSAEQAGTCTIDSPLTQAGGRYRRSTRQTCTQPAASRSASPPKEGHGKADYLLYDEYLDFCMQRRVEDSLASMLDHEVEALKAAGEGCGQKM